MRAFLESLENRLIYAAGLAPSTVGGLTFRFRSDFGGFFTSAGGTYEMAIAPDANTYRITGSGISDGTWSYSVEGATRAEAEIAIDDSFAGDHVIFDLRFNTRTSGIFAIRIEKLSGEFDTGTFSLIGSDDLAVLKEGSLRITGTSGPDRIGLGARDNTLLVTQNNWTRSFNAREVQNILIDLRDGHDSLELAAGARAIYALGGGGHDTLIGGDFNDTLTGGGGRDNIAGGAGSDRLSGLSGNDQLNGGPGVDRLYGGDQDDRLVGGAGVDRLFAGAGNDLLIGNGSSDKLYGESGEDTLIGNAGADLLVGGPDRDTGRRDPNDSLETVEQLISVL